VVARQSKSIAFPEFVMSIQGRLEDIVKSAKIPQLGGEVKTLIKAVHEHARVLVDMKGAIEWETRGGQLAAWNERVDGVATPLTVFMDKRHKVETKLEELRAPERAPAVDDGTGDTVEPATVDDV